MSREKFDANCPGCRPVMLDVRTGKPFPDDSPAMKAINRVWHNMTLPEKEAWHEFTCQNSREPQIMAVIGRIHERMTTAVKLA